MFSVYGINSILYQRGIYPPETFTRVQQYGLTILVTTDDELKKYLANILADVKGGLLVNAIVLCMYFTCLLSKFLLVIERSDHRWTGPESRTPIIC